MSQRRTHSILDQIWIIYYELEIFVAEVWCMFLNGGLRPLSALISVRSVSNTVSALSDCTLFLHLPPRKDYIISEAL